MICDGLINDQNVSQGDVARSHGKALVGRVDFRDFNHVGLLAADQLNNAQKRKKKKSGK